MFKSCLEEKNMISLLLVAKDDVMGRKMQDLNLTVRKRASRKQN